PELLELADLLIETLTGHEGRPRGELEQELAEIQGTDTDFLLHRSFAKLLFDRCEFEAEAPIEPEELRRRVFRAAAEAYGSGGGPDGDGEPAGAEIGGQDSASGGSGPLVSVVEAAPERSGGLGRPFRFDRETVLGRVAAELGVTTAELESGLYADLESEKRLVRFRRVSAEWLLRRYNVALAQGVLLRATELEIELGPAEPKMHRELFRKMKFFRLMHRVSALPGGGWRLVLDGPISLFKASGKYGFQMASFLPTLLHFDSWSLRAELRWGPKRRPLGFELTSEKGLRSHTKLTGQWQPEELSWLPRQFAELETAWQVETGGELVNLGGEGVLVPDFVFLHEPTGTRVVMEILGFWRKGAVDSRLALLRRHGPPNLILAVSSLLATGREDLGDLPGQVYVFRAHPIARKVAKLLEAFLPETPAPRPSRKRNAGKTAAGKRAATKKGAGKKAAAKKPARKTETERGGGGGEKKKGKSGKDREDRESRRA
ncbi:MAG: DUF790 family protein, partial [Holophagales bacterium]|nr:DUF790 family protein [Holophagales bacterium]